MSVVIPTHNRGVLLGQTLGSVRAQRGVDLQVVVVDDGSTDDTAAAVARLADPRVVLVRNARAEGVSAARNRGIDAADGDWIAFLDDDDLWAPDKLASQIGAARAEARGWACGGSVTVGDDLEIVAGAPPAAPEAMVDGLALRNTIPAGASNVLVRTDVLAAAGLFDVRLRHVADWDLWIRLARCGGLPAVVFEPVVAYRLHAGNASASTATLSAELDLMAGRYAELRAGAPIDRAFAYRWAAWHYLRTGRRREALGAYARAIVAGDPLSIGRAAAALAVPQLARRRHLPDPAWAARAAAWLRELRD